MMIFVVAKSTVDSIVKATAVNIDNSEQQESTLQKSTEGILKTHPTPSSESHFELEQYKQDYFMCGKKICLLIKYW